jgi:hypothetical protein
MHFLAGFLTAIALIVAPWFRRPAFDVSCVDDKPCTPIVGISELLKEDQNVNLVMIHGMGGSPSSGYKDFTDAIAIQRLGFSLKKDEPEFIQNNPGSGPPEPRAKLIIRDYEKVEGLKTYHIHVYELQWFWLIAGAKAELLKDDATYPGRRAAINGFLKKRLIDERVADPILYLSELPGERIRHAVKYTICRVSGGHLTDEEQCQAPEGRPALAPTVIVTESLGSQLVADGLNSLTDLSCDSSNGAILVLRSVRSVFMLANQLPLFRYAHTQPDSSGDFDVTKTRCVVSELPTRQEIAVSDPSDLLSYAIPKGTKATRTTFINVTRQLGHRLLLTALVEPLGAHTHGKDDPPVQEMIACGYPKCVPIFPAGEKRR